MTPSEGEPTRISNAKLVTSSVFWREAWRTYGFPFVMFTLAIIPGLNFTYSGHGGISWLLIPLCSPYVAIRAVMKISKPQPKPVAWYKSFFAITIPSYIVLALPLSWAATASLRHTFGLTISPWSFAAIMISPVPYWYFS